MATPKKKIVCDISIDDPVSSDSESELELGDDDIVELNISGTLTFSPTEDSGNKTPQVTAIDTGYLRSRNDSGISSFGAKSEADRTLFEVVATKTVAEGHTTKYVVYTVAVVRNIGTDSSQALIERRYSEFHRLNNQLRRRYPELMQNVAFPKKTITGNFKLQTIAERSRAFEQFLSHIFSFEEVRATPEFEEFFYNRDLKLAYHYISVGEYQEAIPLLQNGLHLQEKILGESHSCVIETLCALVVTYCHIESDAHAHSYAKAALDLINDDDRNIFLVPLVQTMIGICWRIGKDKRHLESQLSRHVNDAIDAESRPQLQELVMMRFKHLGEQAAT
ncbi:sorting nexin-21-like [Glandiceps talaboti]